jgi:type IV pilus assembly protein PilC
VTRVDPAKAEKAAAKVKPKKGAAAPSKNLAIFTRQFSVMIDAGLPLVQCLDILGKQEPDKGFSGVILAVRSDVESGAALADAMK